MEGDGWSIPPAATSPAERTTSERLDPRSGRVRPSRPFGGCQPYITADGELGYWAAGAGGPIDVVDLASWKTRTLLRKNDPRLPADRGYLYFPMISPDRSLLAYAASHDQHDHFRADYDVFLLALDPTSLAPTGSAVRVTADPAVDRYPDVWRLAPPRARIPAGRAPAAARTEESSALAPVFLWRDATDLNRRSPDATNETLEAHGEAWTDRRGRLALAGGYFSAADESGQRVARQLRETNTFTIALVIAPASLAATDGGPIVALTSSPRQRAFVLLQRGAEVALVLRTADRTGPAGGAPIDLLRLPDAAPHHVAIRYSPGRLVAFLDGREVARRPITGDFFHWRSDRLRFGTEAGTDARFHGALARITIWDRELEDDAIAADATQARAWLAGAKAVKQVRIRARLVARSRIPSLEEISPYREALVVEEYKATEGPLAGRSLRVARWALLDGRPATDMSRPIGGEATLELEPYASQQQLESVVLSDTLPPAPGVELEVDTSLVGR